MLLGESVLLVHAFNMSAGLTLRRALLRRQGEVVGWHGHGYRPSGVVWAAGASSH
jgi:hypothetical protein